MSHRIGINTSLSECILNLTQLPYNQPKKITGVSGFLHPAACGGADQTSPPGERMRSRWRRGRLPAHQLQGAESQKLSPAKDAVPWKGGRDFAFRRHREEEVISRSGKPSPRKLSSLLGPVSGVPEHQACGLRDQGQRRTRGQAAGVVAARSCWDRQPSVGDRALAQTLHQGSL